MFRILTILLLTSLTTAHALGADIVLHANASPAGSVVLLGDVAQIHADSTAERYRLATLPLMPTPVAGTVQHLRAQSVRDLLRAQGESLADLRFDGAIVVAVGEPTTAKPLASEPIAGSWRSAKRSETSSSLAADKPANPKPATRRNSGTGFRSLAPLTSQTHTLTTRRTNNHLGRREASDVRDQVREAIQAWLASQGDAGQGLAVGEVTADDENLMRLHQYRQRAFIAQPETMFKGTESSLRFVIAPSGGAPSYASASLVELRQIVTATRPIARGELITASRAAVEGLLPDQVPFDSNLGFDSLEPVLGRIASRAIRSGDPLTQKNTTTPLLVRRGETVSVVTSSEGITVRLQAVARGNGRMGELVTVDAHDRRERFEARVIGHGRLAVLGGSTRTAQLASHTREGDLR